MLGFSCIELNELHILDVEYKVTLAVLDSERGNELQLDPGNVISMNPDMGML